MIGCKIPLKFSAPGHIVLIVFHEFSLTIEILRFVGNRTVSIFIKMNHCVYPTNFFGHVPHGLLSFFYVVVFRKAFRDGAGKRQKNFTVSRVPRLRFFIKNNGENALGSRSDCTIKEKEYSLRFRFIVKHNSNPIFTMHPNGCGKI